MANGAVRVVLADDTPDIRSLLRLMLGRAGYEVVGEAATGAEAVALAEELQPDVVLLDLAMPVMDGLEALPLIRTQAPRAKVIVLSGFVSDRIEREAMEAGADAFVEKGTAPDALVSMVAKVAAGKPVSAVESEPPPPEGGVVDEDLSFVIHELMSPLTVIEGFATMIEARADMLRPEEVRDYGARIARSAAHLRNLIQSVADARRMEGGSLRIAPELLDMGPFVAEVAADLGAVTGAHPVAVSAEPGFVVDADPVRIRQVLTNLLSNAAKFSEASAPIEVAVGPGPDGGSVEVSVCDHGPGIPEERRGALFGRYSRLGSAAPGMGIGLYISRGIARAHGGDLRLADSVPGQGARFVLSLPAAGAGA